MKIPPGDKGFVARVLMPYFRIPRLRMSWSDSKARWPDIWCIRGYLPVIMVTMEWLRQGKDERRKRLVHEFIHLGWGLEHGIHRGLVYSTMPAKDEFSRKVYRDIVSKSNPSRRIYDRYLKDIRRRWDWPGIVRNLEAREGLKPTHEEYPVYYYLGSYLKVGPDAEEEKQHFYEKIFHYPSMYGGMAMASYRLGEWLTALVNVAEEHGLHIYIPDEDPADLYVTLGVSKKERIWHAVDKIEGF